MEFKTNLLNGKSLVSFLCTRVEIQCGNIFLEHFFYDTSTCNWRTLTLTIWTCRSIQKAITIFVIDSIFLSAALFISSHLRFHMIKHMWVFVLKPRTFKTANVQNFNWKPHFKRNKRKHIKLCNTETYNIFRTFSNILQSPFHISGGLIWCNYFLHVHIGIIFLFFFFFWFVLYVRLSAYNIHFDHPDKTKIFFELCWGQIFHLCCLTENFHFDKHV